MAAGYATEWFENTYHQHGATPVSVAVSTDTPNIDFTLDLGGAMSGTVRNADGSVTIGNVSVECRRTIDDQDDWFTTTADANGDYTFSSLPYGDYIVRSPGGGRWGAGDDNYIHEWYDNRTTEGEADPVTIADGVSPSNIDFTLDSGGSISGRVTFAGDGTPIANLHVQVSDYATGQGVGGTNTDAEGNYTLHGLPAGSYRVRACSSCTGLPFVYEYYDDVQNWQDATPVLVTASNDTPDIDFVLDLGGSISGHVYQPDGTTAVEGAGVEVFDYASLSGQWVGFGGVETEADGSYTFAGLPTGTYALRVVNSGYAQEWYQDTFDAQAATPVPVTAPVDTADIDFVLNPGGSISGVVRNANGSLTLGNVSVECWRTADVGGDSHGGTADADGNYIIEGLPYGDYILRAPGGGRWGAGDDNYVQEWYDGKTTQDEAGLVTVAEGVNPSNVDFTLDTGGSISGRVTYLDDGTSMPIANVHVFVVDIATDEWKSGANTDADGYYTVAGLATGTYRVGIPTCGPGQNYTGGWYDDKAGQESADPVSVTAPADTPDIDFVLELTVTRATVEEAIADGVDLLAAQQNPDGSWGTYYQVAKTALAVLKLETHAMDLGYASPFDVGYAYAGNVQAGLDFLFANAYITDITPQPAGDPDTNQNGIGVYFRSPVFPPEKGHAYDTYETAMSLMAVAASTTPARTVGVVGSPVDGWSYAAIAQDTVDYLAWGQTDFGYGRGGWCYGPTADDGGDRSDQSNSGWVTLGLAYAEDFGSAIPGFVRTELNIWIDYLQDDVDGDDDDGGSYYSGPGEPGNTPSTSALRTGNLLQQMAFVGDPVGAARVQDAIDYLVRHWGAQDHRGWRGCPTCHQATYTVMKGLEAFGLATIDSIDWFQDLADAILPEQSADGWWPSSCFDDGERILSTEWALLTLQREIPVTREMPDLVIIEKVEEWIDPPNVYLVQCTLKNVGNLPATEADHYVTLFIDGVAVEAQSVPLQDFAPGATMLVTFSGPFNLTEGDDEVMVCADTNPVDTQYDGLVEELNEQNNCTVNHQPPLRDLAVIDKHEEWVDEGYYRVYFTVQNTGDVTILGGYYVSLSVDGTPIDHLQVQQPLAPGEEYPGSFGAVVPLSDDTDEVTVCADSHLLDAQLDNLVDEVDEQNNCLTNTFPPAMPDLIITEKHEEWVIEGETYTVHYTVMNIGDALAPAGYVVGLRIDGEWDATDVVEVALAPGETVSGSFEYLVPLTDGHDNVFVYVDHDSQVDESDESNNYRFNDIYWPAMPNLRVSKWEEWEVEGESYIVRYLVRNTGNAPAATGFDVALEVDGASIEEQEVIVDTALGPGEEYHGTFAATVPLTDGTDHVRVCVDVNEEVEEGQEVDNCDFNTFSWPPAPDLTVTHKQEQWVDGQEGVQYFVRFWIRNIGNATAPAGHDVALTVDGQVVQTLEVPVDLGPGQWWGGVFAPVSFDGGTDGREQVMVCVDANNEVVEPNEGNNCRTNIWPDLAPACVGLVDGWNIIALALTPDPGYTASSLAGDINDQGGNVTQVFWWNAPAGTWDFYLVDIQYGTDFPIEVGYGYLLKNTVPTEWCYGGQPLSADYVAVVQPMVTNVTDKSFSVSWVSQDAEEGYVEYGSSAGALDQTAYDDRDARPEPFTDDTHHVTITGLSEGQTYYFVVVSGGTTYDNDGAPYELTTGPSLDFTMPDTVNGSVFEADGTTPAEGAIVYAQIGTSSSQVMSALVDDNGNWALNIAQARTADYQDYYPYADADEILVNAQGAALGTGNQGVTVGEAKAGAPPMNVALTVEMDLVDGWCLIALPVPTAVAYTASTMAEEINSQGGSVSQVFWWNAQAGTWDFWLVDIQYGTDFAIELGEGYLLKNGTAMTWVIGGSPVAQPAGPQYGGTLTFAFTATGPTQTFDPVVSTGSVGTAVHTYGRLLTADWSKGPQGTNESPFTSSHIPDQFLGGDLAASWEILDLQTIIFHIRPGVYWHNVPPVNGRELSADDVVYSFLRGQSDPRNVLYVAPEVPPEERTQFTALDPYTVRVDYVNPSIRMLHSLGNWMYVMPAEMVDMYGDLSDWQHQAGTGPFMVTDCVADVSVTWTRNPNYWMDDPFNPENRLPYVDTLRGIVIVDSATRLAALRTGKIDRLFVGWSDVDSLQTTNPEWLSRNVLSDASRVMFLRTDVEPFADKRVRHALSMAIDQPTVVSDYYGGHAHLLTWPVMPSFVTHYTPLNQLPASSQELYEYNPEPAKELLAEAGYPNGFATEVITLGNQEWIDIMTTVKEYLAAIGVEMEIRILESAAFAAELYSKQYPGMAYLAWGNNAVDDALGWAHGGWVSATGEPSIYNFGNVVDPVAQGVFETIQATLDPAVRNSLRKEENVRAIDLCWEIPLPTPSTYIVWAPWLKGYAGEVGVGPDPGENNGVFRYVWIDQELKAEMGY